MLKVILLVAYALFGIIFMLGFIGDRDRDTQSKCLIGVIAMGLLALTTALLLQ